MGESTADSSTVGGSGADVHERLMRILESVGVYGLKNIRKYGVSFLEFVPPKQAYQVLVESFTRHGTSFCKSVCEVLVQNGNDLNKSTELPLSLAISDNQFEVAAILLDCGASVDAIGADTLTPLWPLVLRGPVNGSGLVEQAEFDETKWRRLFERFVSEGADLDAPIRHHQLTSLGIATYRDQYRRSGGR